MKKTLLALSLLLVARTGLAGIEYDFRQTTSSQIEAVPSAEYTGHAIIDGDRSRVEFRTGNFANPGVYLISTGGSRNQIWVDPGKKSYLELDTSGVANVIGTTHLKLSNKKLDSVLRDDHPLIAGVRTDHYTLNISYDITLYMGSLPVMQSVTEVIDKWTTSAFGDVAESYLSGGGLKTNNNELDELISQETTKIKGFALKQTATITTISRNSSAPGSALKVNRTVTQQSEFEVTSISPKVTVAADLFVIPAGYRKAVPLKTDDNARRDAPLEPTRN
jgi:hypothetical protein